MFSTFFKYNIILLVLCIGMELCAGAPNGVKSNNANIKILIIIITILYYINYIFLFIKRIFSILIILVRRLVTTFFLDVTINNNLNPHSFTGY